jgi:hypothetical protein
MQYKVATYHFGSLDFIVLEIIQFGITYEMYVVDSNSSTDYPEGDPIYNGNDFPTYKEACTLYSERYI